MASTRRVFGASIIAMASAIALTVAVAVPANAVSTGARTQLCAGPLDAQIHINTTGYTTLSIGQYGTATYPWVLIFAGGTNAYVDGKYQSYRWSASATTIITATSTCI